jgi:hypothetical protein
VNAEHLDILKKGGEAGTLSVASTGFWKWTMRRIQEAAQSGIVWDRVDSRDTVIVRCISRMSRARRPGWYCYECRSAALSLLWPIRSHGLQDFCRRV